MLFCAPFVFVKKILASVYAGLRFAQPRRFRIYKRTLITDKAEIEFYSIRAPLGYIKFLGAAESHNREIHLIPVVVEHKPACKLLALGKGRAGAEVDFRAESVSGEARARVVGFVPRAVFLVRGGEEIAGALDV